MSNLKDKNILIVGLGMIGGSYAMGLNDKGITPYGFDLNLVTMEYAISNGIIKDEMCADKMISESDLIVLCLYPHLTINWIKENQHKLKAGTIITDVTGVKKYVNDEISKFLRDDVEFVSAHPMAGREVPGIKGADPEVFKSANFIIVPLENNKKESIDLVYELAETLEFKNIEILDADRHDELISYLSQLTHIIAISLMNTKDAEHMVRFTGDSFRDLTRIAKINEVLWSELFLINKDKLINDIDMFQNELESFKNLLVNDDLNGMKVKMKSSTARRKLFDKK